MPFTFDSAMPKRRRLAFAQLLVAALLAANAASAGPFLLSSCAACRQGTGAVAGSPNGPFLALWTGASEGLPAAVPARFFLANGTPRGADFLLSSTPAAMRGDVAAAAEATGFFAAAWSVRRGVNSEIIVQRFKRTLDPFGPPAQVSADTAGATQVDSSPSLTYMPDKGFVVVWERFTAPSSEVPAGDPEVMARRYDMRGHALSPPQRISTGPLSIGHTAVCADRSGTVFAAWTSVDGYLPFEHHKKGVVLRRLSANAQALGDEVKVAPPLAETSEAALACGPSGFTVSWQTDRSMDGESVGQTIMARRYAATGLALGDAFEVSETTSGRLSAPAASQDVSGNVVVAWTEDAANGLDRTEVRFRRIAAADGELGDSVLATEIVRSSAPLPRPAVSHVGRGGDLVIAWSDFGSLVARRYTSDGQPLARAAVPAASEVTGSLD